jgi:hypothetical protein
VLPVVVELTLELVDVIVEEEVELVEVVVAGPPPGRGTFTVAAAPKISVLANVEHKLEAGGLASPCPGKFWLSEAQDSKMPFFALEGALNTQPWVS